MSMTDAILPGSTPRATSKAALIILALSSLPVLLAAGQTTEHDRVYSLFSPPHWPAAGHASQDNRAHTLSSLPPLLVVGQTS